MREGAESLNVAAAAAIALQRIASGGSRWLTERIEEIRKEAAEAIGAASTTAELEELRVRYLGRKAELTQILRGHLRPARRRARSGRQVAATRPARSSRSLLEVASAELDASELGTRLAEDAIDVTLPGAPPVPVGAQNPLLRTQRQIEDIFVGLGYRVMEGPEVELDYYNFTALNHPPGHPARMAQDTFYVDPVHAAERPADPVRGRGAAAPGPEDVVLRTHTSPMQVRAMESQPPPIFIVVPGRCYRSRPLRRDPQPDVPPGRGARRRSRTSRWPT